MNIVILIIYKQKIMSQCLMGRIKPRHEKAKAKSTQCECSLRTSHSAFMLKNKTNMHLKRYVRIFILFSHTTFGLFG
jgi:hypothetical protein